MSARARIGFVGIGLMGEGMVRRLLDQGWSVTVWNREPERLDLVVPHGAAAATGPAAVAAASDIVMLCVLDTGAVEQSVFGPDGVAAAPQAPRLLVDLSTTEPEATREMGSRLRSTAGTGWVDAPVSGGPAAARAGSLTIMAGGSDVDFAVARPALEDLAANLTHMGSAGAGQATKIVNQAIVGAGYVLMAEIVKLAEATGIAADRVPACLAGGAADSTLLRTIYPQMQARVFEPPKAYARQLREDLESLGRFTVEQRLGLPLVEMARARYARHVDAGNEMRDSASVIELYDREGRA